MEKDTFDTAFKSVANIFNILSHSDRLKILSSLRKKEMDVNDLQQAVGISQSRVSQQLKLLKLYGLVLERRDGRHVYYRLKDKRICKVIETAFQFQMIGIASESDLITIFKELILIFQL